MKLIRRDYDFAGTTTMLAGLMHIPHFLWQGWNLSTQTLLIYGLVFLAMGWFLRKRLRWLAYLAYILLLVGMLVTLIMIGTGTTGLWWGTAIMLFQIMATYKLFRILWAPAVPA